MKSSPPAPPKTDIRLQLYRMIFLIRHIDERLKEEYSSRNIRGPVHLSVGQEAIASGVLAACRREDYCVGTHRDHAPYLAKGGDPAAMIDELYGLASGCAKGYGGSMHLADPKVHFMGASAVVGGSIPIAAGMALALKKDGRGLISIGFTGDGATDEGVFFETLNLAALLGLPFLLVVENNGLSTLTPLSKRQASPDIAGKAKSMGVESVRLDGNDVMEIYEKSLQIVEVVRTKSKPYLLEAVTNRLCAHVGPVVFTSGQIGADEELVVKLKREPLKIFRSRYPEFGTRCDQIEREVRSQADRMFGKAKARFNIENKRRKLPPPPPPQPNRV